MFPRASLRLSNDVRVASRRRGTRALGGPIPAVMVVAATALVLASPPSAVYGQGQVLNCSVTHAGYPRHYVLYVPPGYTPGNSTPLVINCHGHGWIGTGQMNLSGMNVVAEREGFLVAYPDAVMGDWYGADGTNPYDDFGFIDSVIGQVSSGYTVDASRVYVTGLSQGGQLAYVLSVARPYTYAAIAPVAALRPYMPGTTTYIPPDVPATPSRPFPLLHVHGTADVRFPYLGGLANDGVWTYGPVEQVTGEYAANNGCDAAPSITDLPDIDLADGCAWKPPDPPCSLSSTVQLLTYGNCGTYVDSAGNARPAEVLLYRVVDGAHSWPGDYVGYSNPWNFPRL
jgi:polyhydroxybutyrate depolymerase